MAAYDAWLADVKQQQQEQQSSVARAHDADKECARAQGTQALDAMLLAGSTPLLQARASIRHHPSPSRIQSSISLGPRSSLPARIQSASLTPCASLQQRAQLAAAAKAAAMLQEQEVGQQQQQQQQHGQGQEQEQEVQQFREGQDQHQEGQLFGEGQEPQHHEHQQEQR